MSSGATASEHGFVAVRGRGYRPEQVDAYAVELSQDRDGAWERAARLTVLAKEMEAEAERLRDVVSRLAPQTYETLGERARQMLALGEAEAAAVREAARPRRGDWRRRPRRERGRRPGGRAATPTRSAAEAEERARQRLLAARAEADEIRVGARRDVKEGRGEALGALREIRQRTAGMLGEQEPRSTRSGGRPAEREAAERAAAWMRRMPSGRPGGGRAESEAKQAFAEAEESVGGGRRRRMRGRPSWWRRRGCGRSGSPGRRSGCCASMGRRGTTCRRTWIMCGAA